MMHWVVRQGACVPACTAGVLLAGLAGGCAVDGHVTAAPGFHATVYETRLSEGQAGKLDAAELNARAAGGEDLAKALAELGRTRVLYRLYQPVGCDSDSRIMLGARVPRIVGMRRTPGGRQQNLVTYERLGAALKLYVQPAGERRDGKLEVRLNAELAIASSDGPAIAPGRRAPGRQVVTLSYNGPAESGRPFVAVSAGGASPGGASTAYICRVVIVPIAPPPEAGPTTRTASSPSAADYQATVYRLQMPAARAGDIDVEALTAAAEAGQLQARLAELGRATLLYQASQPVSLTSENSVQVAARKPFVVGTRFSESGSRVNTVRYQKVGAVFGVSAEPIASRAARRVRVRLSTELSDLAEGKIEVGKDVRVSVVRNAALTYVGGLAVGRPLVAVCLDASCDEEEAVAYVCRIVLSSLR